MKNRKLRYGAMATGFIVFFVAAIVLFNLAVGIASDRFYWKWDMTAGALYDLTDETIAYISDLDEPITVTVLADEETYLSNTSYGTIGQILKKYAALGGDMFTLRFVDPDLNAGLLEKYNALGTLRAYDIVVDSPLRFRSMRSYDLLTTEVDESSYQEYVTGFQAEQKLTSAIMYVSNEVIPRAAIIEGHGEGTLAQLTTLLENNNFTTEKLNLTLDEIPSEVNLLVISGPQLDYSPEETNKLEAYFSRGGDAWVFLDMNTPELPVLERYLAEWGVQFRREVIFDSVRAINNQSYVVPELGSHEIITQMASENMMSLLYAGRPIDVLFTGQGYRETNVLFQTSKDSYAKVVNPDAPIQTLEKESGDTNGPFAAGVLTEQRTYDGSLNATVSRVFFTTQSFVDDSILSMTNLLNPRIMNSIAAYMNPSSETISIEPKQLPDSALNADIGTGIILLILLVAVLPLLLFGAGLAVWLRRRHR